MGMLLAMAETLLPGKAMADSQTCSPQPTEAVVNFQNYSITDNPSLPPGSMLSGAILGQETRAFFNCPDVTGPVTMTFTANDGLTVAPVGGITPNGSGSLSAVYEVPGIHGVGFAIGIRETTHCAGDPVRYITQGNHDVAVCTASDAGNMATQYFVAFYKTATTIDYETPNSGQIYAGYLQLKKGDTLISTANVTVQVAATDLKVHKSSCFVTRTDINVDMGQTSVSDLNNGNDGTRHGFSIPLTCDAGQNSSVKMGFYGPTEPDTTGNGVLTLSKQDGAATGVGIRINYGADYGGVAGKAVPLNSTGVEAFPNSANQTLLNLDYTAQYVKTGDSVTAGQGDSLATFSLIYN